MLKYHSSAFRNSNLMSSFYADSEAPIVLLSARKHFEALSTPRQLYAHHLSKASFWGSRAVLRSVSPESEPIFDLILAIHKALATPATNEAYTEALGDSAAAYLEYALQFLGNLGNYKSFGDKKFVPRLSPDQFDQLIEKVGDSHVKSLYQSVKSSIYDTSVGLLGWPDQGQLSSYYLSEISKSEVDSVNAAMQQAGIMPENSRVEKTGSGFVVHIASADTTNTTGGYGELTTADGVPVTFKFGDHSKEFEQVVAHLKQALKYVANDTQAKMLEHYIESFKSGDMQAHKKSQIEWVKDLQPEVELNVGFIETYRDPSGVRGEWEGLVAMVNKERTATFLTLVENATKFISLLPWDHFYEKDTFNPPDFTSLEVLTFAGLGVPAGINIPNYDDVRLNYGFKNVSLGNVLGANPKNPRRAEVITFLLELDQELFKKYREPAFEVQVGLHELLGHGSGKLLQETSPGKFNFDKSDPRATSCYGPADSWGSLFGLTAGSYEECRAELVALYLILKSPDQVLPIFGFSSEEEKRNVKFIATMLMGRAGLLALEFWDPETKIWGQPHMRARFGITKTLIEAGVVSLDHSESDFLDLELHVDESKLSTSGVEALGLFLSKLHVYKSTGNVKEGVAFYNDKTEVTPDYAKFRDLVLSKKLPRKQLIQANTVLNGEKVEVKEYEETEVGMIQSYYEREL